MLPSPIFSAALVWAVYTDVSKRIHTVFVSDPAPSIREAHIVAAEEDPRTVSAARGGLQGVATAKCVIPECTEMKAMYDQCFFEWYRTEYIHHGGPIGQTSPSPEPCGELFAAYKRCLVTGMAKADILNLDDLKVDIPSAR
eukprot:m.259260 g.259260  ORF g.259260 m.259260 type:complete len:141 (+) comp15975_c1_seq5:1062-1484(+)